MGEILCFSYWKMFNDDCFAKSWIVKNDITDLWSKVC